MTDRNKRSKFLRFSGKLMLVGIWIILLTILSFQQTLNAQIDTNTVISGVINTYTRVLNVYSPGTDSVKVADTTGFHRGDAVLIVQMKVPSNDPSFTATIGSEGESSTALLTAGKYEIIKIKDIRSNFVIVFSTQLTPREYAGDIYNPDGFVQLIRVPIYKKVTVSSAGLTCKPWSDTSGTGGILAFLAIGQLILDGNIDVTGKGFHGADPGTENYTGICTTETPSISNINFSATSMDRAGRKGEGVVTDDTLELKGRGRRVSNPGGGLGRFSGGGGGGSYSKGGNGGNEICSGQGYSIGGVGGDALFGSISTWNYIYLGSGGGAGTQLWPSAPASKGGNGGGIVIIVAPKIISHNKSIIADGMYADSSAIAGGGGGGGGGMILLDAESCSGTLKLDAVGGQGGCTNITKVGTDTIIGGPGGGGGAGTIWYRLQLSYIINLPYSNPGKILNSPLLYDYAQNGYFATPQSDVHIQLTGFLFNYLPADDTICKGSHPHKIIGSRPRGGTDTTYNYQWFVSTNLLTWDSASVASFGASLKDFQPPDSITNYPVIYYKRVVRSAYDPVFVTFGIRDESSVYSIHVYPPVTNNIISSADSILCSGTILRPMSGTSPGGGNLNYLYSWVRSSDLSNWSTADSVNTGQNYSPAKKKLNARANDSDSLYYFKRQVISGGCTSNSNLKIIRILPLIKRNHIAVNQVLCQSGTPTPLHPDSIISGGDGTYRYKWQSSYFLKFSPSDSISNLDSISPDTLKFNRYYRRIAYSGLGDACKSTSDTITITVRPAISNNTLISTDDTICAETAPKPFLGNKPLGGDTILHYYEYAWKISTDNLHWSEVFNSHGDTTGYTSGTLNKTSWFKRVVVSGVEGACKDSGNLLKVTVHPRIANNLLSNGETICFGQIPTKLFTSDSVIIGGNGIYTYKWQESFNKLNSSGWSSPLHRPANQYNLAPDTLYYDRYYRRIVISGACTDTMQNPIQPPLYIRVLPPVGNNNVLIPDTIVCKGTSPDPMKLILPTGGNGNYDYSWFRGNNRDSMIIILSETTPVYNAGNINTNTFIIRKVISGPCLSNSDTIKIQVHPLPVGYLTGLQDTSICDNGRLRNARLTMNHGKVPWAVYLSNSFSVLNISAYDTIVDIPASTIFLEKQVDTLKISSLIDNNKCSAISNTGQVIVTEYSAPVSATFPLKDTVCGNQAVLKGTMPGYAIGTWRLVGLSDVSISDLNNPAAIITNNHLNESVLLDTVNIIWTVYNWNSSCYVQLPGQILFYNKPVARIMNPSFKKWIGRKDTTIFNLDTATLVANNIKYPNIGRWDYASTGTPLQFTFLDRPATQVQGLLTNDTPGNWTVYWTVQNAGCPANEDTAFISSSRIHPYKGFSPGYGLKDPGGSPLDEYYWIEGIEYEQDFTLTILSGWNKVVYIYHGSGQNWQSGNGKGWDGKGNQIDNNGKDAPEGTYFYILEVKDQKYTGSILLRRKG